MIHALCVVKNEVDIVNEMLMAALRWCDFIYIMDNGSSDGTWEEVLRLSGVYPQIRPYKQDDRPFADEIRNELWSFSRSAGRTGDWWCILDADEFYIDNPKDFLQTVPKPYNAIWMVIYTYLFTERDLKIYCEDPDAYHLSPVETRMRHYVIGDYTEMRFFRHPETDCLKSAGSMPVADRIWTKRIRMKHFAYRSPEQIQTRLETRREPMLRGCFVHEKRANWVKDGVLVEGPAQFDELPESWKERVASSSECHYDAGDGVYPDAGPWTPPEPRKRPSSLRAAARAFLGKRSRERRRYP